MGLKHDDRRWSESVMGGASSGKLGGHVGSDREQGGIGPRVFKRQFLIAQFFM